MNEVQIEKAFLDAEGVLVAFYPQRNTESELCARKLLAACISGKVAVDWSETERLAKDPCYGIYDELKRLKMEAAAELKKSQ